MAPAYMVLDQSAIAEGGKLFPVIFSHLRILNPEVCGPAFSLGWFSYCREFPIGEEGEGLSGGNYSLNVFSKLGACADRFKNLSPSIARMNNHSPSLTNPYLDTPLVGPTPDPLEYIRLSGHLGQTHRYPLTRTGVFPQTGASNPPALPPTSTL